MAGGAVDPLHGRRAAAALTPARHLVAFLALACLFSWAWWVPVAVAGSWVERGDGWPTHVPGLLGPMLAAGVVLAATEGRTGLRAWLAAMVRWPRAARWQVAALAPLGFLALGIAVVAVTSGLPAAGDFIRFSGAAPTVWALALVVNGFGEEAGWRGYALPRLQARLGALRATLVLAAGWALWHVPLFFMLGGFRDFSPIVLPGWFIGLLAGAFVLTSVYNGAGGSILAVAVWHAAYNLSSATDAADGTIAAVSTTCVIVWAVALVLRERAGRPALGGPRAPRSFDLGRKGVTL